MKTLAAILLGGLALAQLATSPAEAAKARPSFHEATVILHFAGPGGKSQIITEAMYVYGCPVPGLVDAERQQHRVLPGMTFTGMTCGPPPERKGLAVIMLRFSVGGEIRPAAVDHDGTTPITTKTCLTVLQRTKSALVARFSGHFPGSTFVDASCWAMRDGEGPMDRIN